jgi:hypothetical protein
MQLIECLQNPAAMMCVSNAEDHRSSGHFLIRVKTFLIQFC